MRRWQALNQKNDKFFYFDLRGRAFGARCLNYKFV
jgi:hypothetical protein